MAGSCPAGSRPAGSCPGGLVAGGLMSGPPEIDLIFVFLGFLSSLGCHISAVMKAAQI